MDKIADIAHTWLRSRNIIMEFLRELCPDMQEASLEHNASAIIARLAAADPPLLICTEEEMKP